MIAKLPPFLLAICLFSCFLLHAQQSVQQADAVCETCHRDIYRKYITTPMANASGMAVDRFFAGDFTHAPSGVRYKLSRGTNGPTLTFADTHDPRINGTHQLLYFLGSGHLGTTYLYLQDGYLMESPVAWYASTHTYDMKPGFGDVKELPSALPVEPGCLRCHMSGVAPALDGTQNRYAGLPFAQGGITCESCHGNTAAHVQSGGKAPVLNPAKLTPERRDSVCMSCHLEGNVAVARANKSQLAYQPGDRLSDFLSFFVLANGDPLQRGVSEVEQFSTSHCKRASGDRMSCSSCHDPHGSPSPTERVAFYRAKCLNCHSAPAIAVEHHPENPDCTSCHMPRSGAQNTPHVAWTDHRILRRPETSKVSALNPETAKLTPIFSPQADQRDLAVAMYNAVMAGDLQRPNEALAALRHAYNSGAHDTAMLEDLGALSAMLGDASDARPILTELLRSDPKNLSGLSNMGIYLARDGNYTGAIDLLTSAFSRNAFSPGLGRNLAAVQCAAGDSLEARRTLFKLLSLSPGSRETWDFACPTK